MSEKDQLLGRPAPAAAEASGLRQRGRPAEPGSSSSPAEQQQPPQRPTWATCVALYRAAMAWLGGFMHTVSCGLCGRRLVTAKEVGLPKPLQGPSAAKGTTGGHPAACANGTPEASEIGSQTALVAAGHSGTSQEARALASHSDPFAPLIAAGVAAPSSLPSLRARPPTASVPRAGRQGVYFYKPRAQNDRGDNEYRMLTLVQEARQRSERIGDFVSELHGMVERDGKPNFKLTNMLSPFENPRLMDCKIGVRCFEESILKPNEKLRADLYERWSKMDATVLTAEEHARGSITKSRWMALRDSRSSTQTLGFRIDAVATPHGHKTADDSELFRVREDDEVLAALRSFLPWVDECAQATATATQGRCHPREIARDILARLLSLEVALRQWGAFRQFEFVGSSLFFLADATGRSDVKMIDFGVTTPVQNGTLQHDQPWVQGNHEDGYLTGVHNLQRLWRQLVEEDSWL